MDFADERLHDAFVALVRTIDVEKFEPGPLRRRFAANNVVDHALVDDVLAPSIGIEGTERRECVGALLIAEAGAAVAVCGSRGGVNESYRVCGAPLPEVQREADIDRDEFVDVGLGRRGAGGHMDDDGQLVAVASEPLEQGLWTNDVMQASRSEVAP